MSGVVEFLNRFFFLSFVIFIAPLACFYMCYNMLYQLITFSGNFAIISGFLRGSFLLKI